MYKILLADDEGIMLDSLKMIIEKTFGDDCAIECAKSGRAVIEISERFHPDIAFMDLQMPGINGIQAMLYCDLHRRRAGALLPNPSEGIRI